MTARIVPFGGEHRKPWIDGPRIVSTSAERAKAFFGFTDEPIDLGPPEDPSRYQPGAHVYVFQREPFTIVSKS